MRSFSRILTLLSVAVMITANSLAFAQQKDTAISVVTAPVVRTVEIAPANPNVEVGQHVRFSAIVKDASGKPLSEKATGWFAAPFDLAKADEDGTVSFYQPGEVTIVVLVGGKPTLKKVTVRPAPVKSVEIAEVRSPL